MCVCICVCRRGGWLSVCVCVGGWVYVCGGWLGICAWELVEHVYVTAR